HPTDQTHPPSLHDALPIWKKNPDRTKAPPVWSGLVADVGVKFKLVKITRTHTSRTSFGDDDSVKSAVRGGVVPWPTNKYLNVWRSEEHTSELQSLRHIVCR